VLVVGYGVLCVGCGQKGVMIWVLILGWGFRVLGFRVWGLGFRFQCSGLRVQGFRGIAVKIFEFGDKV